MIRDHGHSVDQNYCILTDANGLDGKRLVAAFLDQRVDQFGCRSVRVTVGRAVFDLQRRAAEPGMVVDEGHALDPQTRAGAASLVIARQEDSATPLVSAIAPYFSTVLIQSQINRAAGIRTVVEASHMEMSIQQMEPSAGFTGDVADYASVDELVGVRQQKNAPPPRAALLPVITTSRVVTGVNSA